LEFAEYHGSSVSFQLSLKLERVIDLDYLCRLVRVPNTTWDAYEHGKLWMVPETMENYTEDGGV